MPETIDTGDQHIHVYDEKTKKCRWCEKPEHQINGAWPVGTWFQRRRPIALANCYDLKKETE